MFNPNLKKTKPLISLASLFIFAVCMATSYHTNAAKLVISPITVQQDTVKKEFHEPGLNIPNPSAAYLDMKYSDLHKKPMPVSKRLFMMNDKQLAAGTVGGVENASYIILLDPKQAEKKYGEKGKFGAIEVYGKEIEILNMPASESGEGS